MVLATIARMGIGERTNKDGQALGRKGAESRARLLDAARALVAETPAEKLTASAIARAAELAPQTFYLYFDGVDEVLLSLAAEASHDTGGILAALERPRDGATPIQSHAEQFIGAFYRYWDRHRAILNIRNFRADAGQEPFVHLRNGSSTPIVERIAALIHARPGSPLTEREAFARAVIIFAAIERMAARYASIVEGPASISSGDLKQAEAAILALLISPEG